MSIPIKNDLEKLDEVIHDAVSACCIKLDPYFPGYENRGIDSNMAGEIERTIRRELLKRKLILE